MSDWLVYCECARHPWIEVRGGTADEAMIAATSLGDRENGVLVIAIDGVSVMGDAPTVPLIEISAPTFALDSSV